MSSDIKVSSVSRSSGSNNPYTIVDNSNGSASYDNSKNNSLDLANGNNQNANYDDIRQFINLYLGGVKITPEEMLDLYQKLLEKAQLSSLDQQQLAFLQAQINNLANQKGDLDLSYMGKILSKLEDELKEFRKSDDLSKNEVVFSKELLSEIQNMKSTYNEFYDMTLRKQLLAIPVDKKNEFNDIFKEKTGHAIFNDSHLDASKINDATTQINLVQTLSQEGRVNPNNLPNKGNTASDLTSKRKKDSKEVDSSSQKHTLGVSGSLKSKVDLNSRYELKGGLEFNPSMLNYDSNLGIYSQSSNSGISSIALGNLDGLTRAALVLIMVSANSAETLNTYSQRLYAISDATRQLNKILTAFQQLSDFYALNGGSKSTPIDLFKELQLYANGELNLEGSKISNTAKGFANQCGALLDLLMQHLGTYHIPKLNPNTGSGPLIPPEVQLRIMQDTINDFNSKANYVNGDLNSSLLFRPSVWADIDNSPFYNSGVPYTNQSRFVFTRSLVAKYLGQQSSSGESSGTVLGPLSQLITSATSANQTMVAKQNLMSQGVTQFFSLVQSTVSYLSKLIQ